jgi:UDP-2,3-diacylglucosamine hydrolase
MRRIFIADAHLKQPDNPVYRHFQEFLRSLQGNVDELFIMGDLFDFWIGYPTNAFPHYQPVLDQLARLVAGGTRIVYFEGNHDFHLGPVFTEQLGAEVHPGPAVMTLDGKKVYLCHGDQINEKDRGARMLRAVLHGSITKALISVVPPAVSARIAVFLGGKSKRNYPKNNRKWDRRAILREFAARCFAEGCDMVVAGHFHDPFTETDEHGRVLVSLGDWLGRFSYGEWENNGIALKKYL